jgi:hypothetical protein
MGLALKLSGLLPMKTVPRDCDERGRSKWVIQLAPWPLFTFEPWLLGSPTRRNCRSRNPGKLPQLDKPRRAIVNAKRHALLNLEGAYAT